MRVRALYMYRQQHDDDISFEKGDIMELVDNKYVVKMTLVLMSSFRVPS